MIRRRLGLEEVVSEESSRRMRIPRLKGTAVGLLCLAALLAGQQSSSRYLEPGRVFRMSVISQAHWTDTTFDVQEGQEILFRASGQISLQRGNPIARCGPNGYGLQTVQQPLRDMNLGALIGRIVKLVAVEVDEETGEEKRIEEVEFFHIGAENRIRMPLSGRLFLGINEGVVEDNFGEFSVIFYWGDEAADVRHRAGFRIPVLTEF